MTIADVNRVAKQWLQPDKLIILIGGNIEESKAGADKYGDGTVHVVPLK